MEAHEEEAAVVEVAVEAHEEEAAVVEVAAAVEVAATVEEDEEAADTPRSTSMYVRENFDQNVKQALMYIRTRRPTQAMVIPLPNDSLFQ